MRPEPDRCAGSDVSRRRPGPVGAGLCRPSWARPQGDRREGDGSLPPPPPISTPPRSCASSSRSASPGMCCPLRADFGLRVRQRRRRHHHALSVPAETAQGWAGGYLFHQPALEEALRRRLAAAHRRNGSRLDAPEDFAGMQTASPPRSSAMARRARCAPRYLVACDGAIAGAQGARHRPHRLRLRRTLARRRYVDAGRKPAGSPTAFRSAIRAPVAVMLMSPAAAAGSSCCCRARTRRRWETKPSAA